MKIVYSTLMVLALTIFSGFAVAKSINVNQASAQELAEALNGIGLAKAKAIVEDREKNGEFKTAADVARVKGVGPATISRNKDVITVK